MEIIPIKTTFKVKVKVRANGVYKQVVLEVTTYEGIPTDKKVRDKCRSLIYELVHRH